MTAAELGLKLRTSFHSERLHPRRPPNRLVQCGSACADSRLFDE